VDQHQRSMARARAEWRAKRAGKTSRSLWGFERWGDEPTQEHHPGRRKFSPEETITIPAAMHPELTRRGEEEHPPLGSGASNQLEREARLHRGWSDMHAVLSDAHRLISDNMFIAVGAGSTIVEVAHIPKGLLFWSARIAHYLALVVDRVAAERTNDRYDPPT
jgi:hypothetical protein